MQNNMENFFKFVKSIFIANNKQAKTILVSASYLVFLLAFGIIDASGINMARQALPEPSASQHAKSIPTATTTVTTPPSTTATTLKTSITTPPKTTHQSSEQKKSSSTEAIKTEKEQPEELTAKNKSVINTNDSKVTNSSSYGKSIAKWQAINSDVKAWINVPGTNISYPVVSPPSNDYSNTYYLAKDYYKKSSRNGVIAANVGTTFGKSSQVSKNTVLFGHNWTNCIAPLSIGDKTDVMFAQLPSFHYKSFAEKNPYIYYSTAKEDMVYEIFAVFYTTTSFNYITRNPNDSAFNNIVATAKSKSLHKYNVPVSSKDKILTLSTCTWMQGMYRSDTRFVVMAKLVGGQKNSTASISGSSDNSQSPDDRTPETTAKRAKRTQGTTRPDDYDEVEDEYYEDEETTVETTTIYDPRFDSPTDTTSETTVLY